MTPPDLTSVFLVQFKLLNPRLFKSFYEAGKDSEGNKVMKKWADLDGSVLQSRTGALPPKRACAFHAYWAVKYAELNFKLEEGKVKIPNSAFSSPGFDQGLMTHLLQDLQLLSPRKLTFDSTADFDLEPYKVSPPSSLPEIQAMWHTLLAMWHTLLFLTLSALICCYGKTSISSATSYIEKFMP